MAQQQQQQQQHDPALTMADTQALLGTDFPTMREFGQHIGSSDPLFDFTGQKQRADAAALRCGSFSGDSMQQRGPTPGMRPGSDAPTAPQLRAVCKAEPASPVAGNGGWVPVSDWNGAAGPYDGFMGASFFGDFDGECGDMDTQYGIDAASWNAADEDCGGFMHAEMFQPVMKSMPVIRTVPADTKQDFGSYGPLGSEASNNTGLPTGSGSPAQSPAGGMSSSVSGSDASACNGAAFDNIRTRRRTSSCTLSSDPSNSASVAGPAVLSASQQCAADLMPAIGGGFIRRVPHLGAKPSDAELKETIVALQRTTSRVPGSSDEAHTVTRAECLERYREKKLRRLDVNTIRYMKRKINADRRPRIKGRFVKAEELDAYRAGLLPGQDGIPVSL